MIFFSRVIDVLAIMLFPILVICMAVSEFSWLNLLSFVLTGTTIQRIVTTGKIGV